MSIHTTSLRTQQNGVLPFSAQMASKSLPLDGVLSARQAV